MQLHHLSCSTRRIVAALALLGLSVAFQPGVHSRVQARPAPVATAVVITDPDAATSGAKSDSAGSRYRFTTTLDSKPVRWDPCAPIHWQFSAAQAPADGKRIVAAAVARIAQATQTRWVFDGTVKAAPTSAWLPRSHTDIRPVLIGWTDARHSDLLRNQSSKAAGVARTAWFGRTSDGRTTGALKAGVIALNAASRLPASGPMSWRTVTLHELGHVMGLDHAGSSRELMYPTLRRDISDFRSGDLQGLDQLGRKAGCLPS